MTSVSKNHFTVRLNEVAIGVVRKSGETPSDWLRQAVQLRLESEQQATTTVNHVEGEIESLEQDVTQLRKEMIKLQQSDAITQATLADVQKGLGILEKNQHVLHEMLIDLSQSMRQQFEALGRSLLTDLREQLRSMVETHIEPTPKPLPPVLPRRGL